MKFLIKFRKSVMYFVKTLIAAAVTFFFVNIWVTYYPDAIFFRNGNYLIAFSYVMLFIIFSSNFKAFHIGIYRTHEIIYYFTIALFLTNLFTYFELSLIAEYLLNPLPLIFGTLVQILIIAISSYCANSIYFTIYKARKMLAVFGDEEGFKLINKMAEIPDRFRVEQGVNANTHTFEEIKHLIDKYECVILCNVEQNLQRKILLYSYSKQKRTYLLPDIADIIVSNSYEIQIADIPVLMNRNRGLTDEQKFVKRTMDIIVSALLIILTSPIMLVTALSVKIQDGGPILFRQNRITRNGKFFNILKFRSMIVGADKIKGVKKTEKDDKRITKVGRVIRKYRIDELPQLFNVLMGSMSMVGPRPENAENVYEYSKANPEFELRHRVKAGITGFAQIYGKHNTSPENKLKMDLTYIETYSILRDVKLMILTVKTIFTKNSAEGFEHSQEEE